MATSYIQEPSNAVLPGGDSMPSRSDQTYRIREKTAVAYLVSTVSLLTFELVKLTLLCSERDATI